MNRRRNIVISLSAALLSAILVYSLYQLQLNQLERQETIAIIVPKRFVAAGERLELQDLELKRLPNMAYASEMLVDMNKAIGMETIMPIGKGEPILEWKLNHHYLQPRKTESTFQIPKEYIRSISNGIRAGDRVLLYASGEGGVSRRVFEQSVIVASVKSTGNVEIDNMDQPHLLSLADSNKERMYAARRDANGMIEYLNLNLTEAQWLELDSLCKEGIVKLVVAYSPESFDRLNPGVYSEEEVDGP